MLYKDIPNINILDNEFVTSKQIREFLNISKSIFDRMKIHPEKMDGTRNLYSRDELLNIIKNRIEIYKESEFIPGFPNYIINQKGDIYLVKGKVIPYHLKYRCDKDGYYDVALSNEYGKKYLRVHRLVAMTYLSNPFNLPEVNHKDGNKQNNNVKNLEWCTTKYNIQHAFDNNLNKTGIENWKSSPVIAYKNNGNIDAIFENILSCANYYNINERTVRDSDKNQTTNGRCGYYFRRTSKENFYKLKENRMYARYFVEYKHTRKCTENSQHIA